MTNLDKLKNIISVHESLKAKGLRLTADDIHLWIGVLDDLIDIQLELGSEHDECKAQIDDMMDTRHILMKDAEGGSDTVVKAKVKKEFTVEIAKVAELKKYAGYSKDKQESVGHYINLAKKVIYK